MIYKYNDLTYSTSKVRMKHRRPRKQQTVTEGQGHIWGVQGSNTLNDSVRAIKDFILALLVFAKYNDAASRSG